MTEKRAYICGPLTELELGLADEIKLLYSRLADVCKQALGIRAFVPHEHYDPIKHAHFTPKDVYQNEKRQVTEQTNLLVVVAVCPTWGGGMEVGWCDDCNIPIVLLKPKKNVSRLLRGCPGIKATIEFDSAEEAVEKFRSALRTTVSIWQNPTLPRK